MRKGLLLVCCVVLLFAFSGCQNVTMDVEGLMKAPQMSEEQRRIYHALESAVGEDIVLKYPQNGDYRTAFVFWDLDFDGEDEVLVFYELPSDSTQNLRIHVLDKKNGNWVSLCDAAGLGNEVDCIQFSLGLSEENRCSLLIGFSQDDRRQKKMGLYHLEENMLQMDLDEELTYTAFSLLQGEEKNALLLLLSDEQGARAQLFYEKDGQMKVQSEASLYSETVGFAQVLPGNLLDGVPAVFLDETLPDGQITTDILLLENGTLTPLLPDVLPQALQRVAGRLSSDIDGDGVTEVPQDVLASEAGQPALYYTRWSAFDQRGGIVVKRVDFINEKQGYRFILPDGWVETVGLQAQNEVGEYRFIEKETGKEKLRIRTYIKNDYFDKNELQRYTVLQETEQVTYYVLADEENGLSLDEVRERFSLLQNEE